MPYISARQKIRYFKNLERVVARIIIYESVAYRAAIKKSVSRVAPPITEKSSGVRVVFLEPESEAECRYAGGGRSEAHVGSVGASSKAEAAPESSIRPNGKGISTRSTVEQCGICAGARVIRPEARPLIEVEQTEC